MVLMYMIPDTCSDVLFEPLAGMERRNGAGHTATMLVGAHAATHVSIRAVMKFAVLGRAACRLSCSFALVVAWVDRRISRRRSLPAIGARAVLLGGEGCQDMVLQAIAILRDEDQGGC